MSPQPGSVQRLAELQTRVNNRATFSEQTAEAKKLWKSKRNSKVGRTAFDDIKTVLESMAVSVIVCNYCEQAQANDIEHIAPKGFFPNLAFVWENYILSCKQCNTGYKSDKCFVLNETATPIEMKRGQMPRFQEMAFINIRTEDPNAFRMLNMRTFKFHIFDNLSPRDRVKANITLEILELNRRDTLIKARREAARYYYSRAEKIVAIQRAASVPEIKRILTPYDLPIEPNADLLRVKNDLLAGFKRDIRTHQHPSVWYAIKKVESKVDQKGIRLFDALSEMRGW